MSDSIELQTLTWYVCGRVQGVGFRYFTQQSAHKLGLTGTVCNLSDGRVKVVARGTADQLLSLYAAIRNGPGFAHVTEITEEKTTDPDRNYDAFNIIQ